MPKMKTTSSAKKRFSITGSGKIKRKHTKQKEQKENWNFNRYDKLLIGHSARLA